MAKINIYKGERPSTGAMNLRDGLRARGDRSLVLRAEGSVYRGAQGDVVVNWGTITGGSIALVGHARLLNMPTAVAKASNKLACLKVLHQAGVPIVPFFTTYGAAVNYIINSGGRLYVRTNLRGHSGDGIHIMVRNDDPQLNADAVRNVEFPIHNISQGDAAPEVQGAVLFTVGHIGKRVEWRAHVVDGGVILLQKKLRRTGGPNDDNAAVNTLVRNAQTGWVYSVNFDEAEESPQILENLRQTAALAIQALSLDFGAVDLIVDNATGTARVLEINTAPGIEGDTTIERYAEAFHNLAQQ